MHRVAEVLLQRGDGEGHARWVRPAVDLGHCHEVGEDAVAVDAEDAGLRAEVALAGAAQDAGAADHVGLHRDQRAQRGAGDAVAVAHHDAAHLVAHDHRRRDDAIGGPGVPVADVEVGAADRRRLHLQEHLAPPRPRRRHLTHLEAGAGARLHYGAHLHHHNENPEPAAGPNAGKRGPKRPAPPYWRPCADAR